MTLLIAILVYPKYVMSSVSIFAFLNLFELMNEKFKIERSPLLLIEKSPFGLLLPEKWSPKVP